MNGMKTKASEKKTLAEHLRSFRYQLDGDSRFEFQLNTYQSLRLPLAIVGFLILFFEAVMIVFVVTKSEPVYHTSSRDIFFVLYVALFCVTLLCLVLFFAAKNYLRSKPEAFLNGCLAYSFFICLWGAFLSAYAHRNAVDFSVFMYICLSVSVLVSIRPLQALVLYGASWAFFMLMLDFFADPSLDIFTSRLNSAFVCMLCVCVSSVMYRSKVENFINNKTILEQNRQIQRMNERLNDMVTTDDLTQVYNRRFMDREFPLILEAAGQNNEAVTLMMIDIDSFKQYNDIYGHQEGDQCLRRIATAIQSIVPAGKGFFARYGGEEFLLLAVSLDKCQAEDLAETVRTRVLLEGIPHSGLPEGIVTVSLGVCHEPQVVKARLSHLIHQADSAMYRAKAAGKNRWRSADMPPETA